MGLAVCMGAAIQCSFGVAPGVLVVPLINRCMSMMPIATVMDNKPFMNILPFGMCQSIANPVVAAATAAALGVLTPMPCIPATTAPWTPGAATVQIAGFPALNKDSTLMCMWGGVIQINSPGITNVMIP